MDLSKVIGEPWPGWVVRPVLIVALALLLVSVALLLRRNRVQSALKQELECAEQLLERGVGLARRAADCEEQARTWLGTFATRWEWAAGDGVKNTVEQIRQLGQQWSAFCQALGLQMPANGGWASAGAVDWEQAVRRFVDSLAAEWEFKALAEEAKAKCHEQQEALGKVSGKLERLQKDLQAIKNEDLSGLRDRLMGVLGALEKAAYLLSLRDFWRRILAFHQLCDRLREEILRRFEDAALTNSAAGHYHGVLSQLVSDLERRVGQAKDTVGSRNWEALAVCEPEELQGRLAALKLRASRLARGEAGYLKEQASPSVQQYLRPLVDMLVRDFVSPLLQESHLLAGGDDDVLDDLARAVLRVMEETLGFVVVVPKIGDPVDEQEHDEAEVRAAEEGRQAGTVAAVLEPGFRWESDLVVRARIRSYR